MDFSTICAELIDQTITIEGSIGQITRQAYFQQYIDWINPEQFVPYVDVNIISSQIGMSNTTTINFTVSDITTATDWICINRTN